MGPTGGDLERCYQVLDLEPGASPEALKEAYQDLVTVWDPERFADNARLRRKVKRKLKKIYQAYWRLQVQQSPAAAAAEPSAAVAGVAVPSPAPAWTRPPVNEAIMAGMVAVAIVIVVVVFCLAYTQLTTSPVPVALAP